MFGENREAWGVGAVGLAMIAAAASSSTWLALLAYAVAWIGLFAVCLGRGTDRRLLAVFLLVPLYAAASWAAPETTRGEDTWFDADDHFYVDMMRADLISPRHAGFPVFFGIVPALAGSLGEERALAVVRAGSAVAGALAAVAAFTAVGGFRAGAAGWVAILAGSLTLGRWATAAVIESTMYSLALWVAALRWSWSGDALSPARAAVAGVFLGTALAVSLDNAFLAVPLIVPILVAPGRRIVPRARAAGALFLVAALALGAIAMAAFHSGRVASDVHAWAPLDDGTVPGMHLHLAEFVERYVYEEFLFEPIEILSSGFRVFVMAVVAQPGIPAVIYSKDPRAWMLAEPATLILLALFGVTVAAAWPGWRARALAPSTPAGISFLALAAFVPVRFVWHVLFAPREVLIFTPQIHLAAAMLVASAAGAVSEARRRLLLAASAALVLLLLVANGAYLFRLP